MLIRTNVNLEQKQLMHAKHFCREHHLTISEILRQALDRYLEEQEHQTPSSLFGLFKGTLPDGVEYQRSVRDHED